MVKKLVTQITEDHHAIPDTCPHGQLGYAPFNDFIRTPRGNEVIFNRPLIPPNDFF